MQTPTPVRSRQVVCRSLAGLFTIAAFTVALVDVGPVLVVIDGRLQPMSRFIAGFLAAAMVLLLLDAVLPARRADGRDLPAPGQKGSGCLGGLAAVGTFIAVVAAFLAELDTHAVTLTPTGSDGCVLIALESSFLFSGSGTVYAWRDGELLASAVGGYSSDDAYLPFRRGDYHVTWYGSTAQIRLVGEQSADVTTSTLGRAACS